MIQGKKILAVIPARGGSKGIPNKNIIPLAGKPLIAWTIEEAKSSSYIDRLIVSSDSEAIIAVAKEYGCEVPFIRPAHLALDTTPGIDPVIHAIEALKEKYDLIVLLQPTSPLRTVQDIDRCIEKANETGFCVSVVHPDKSPYWMFTSDDTGRLVPLLKSEAVRRQDLPQVFALNGAVYVAEVTKMLREKSFLTPETTYYLMPKERSIDIDDKMDLLMCEQIIKEKRKGA